MNGLISRIRSSERGLLGTWVKIPSFKTVQLIAHTGFDFVVVDMEHAPHSLERRLIIRMQPFAREIFRHRSQTPSPAPEVARSPRSP